MPVMRTEQNQPLVKIFLHSMWDDLRVAWFLTVKEFHVQLWFISEGPAG